MTEEHDVLGQAERLAWRTFLDAQHRAGLRPPTARERRRRANRLAATNPSLHVGRSGTSVVADDPAALDAAMATLSAPCPDTDSTHPSDRQTGTLLQAGWRFEQSPWPRLPHLDRQTPSALDEHLTSLDDAPRPGPRFGVTVTG